MHSFSGFIVGWGTEYQRTCRTNKHGPERYKKCAPGVILPNGIKHKHAKKRKKSGRTFIEKTCTLTRIPQSKLCKKFERNHRNKFTSEIVIVPNNKSADPEPCFRDGGPREKFGHYVETSNGWCGTCVYDATKNSK